MNRLLALAVCCALSLPAAAVQAADAPKAESSPAPRVPWTSSRVTGSPEPPPPFKSARAWPQAKFDRPLQITRLPGDERLFISEEHGKIFSLKPGADAKPELFLDLAKAQKVVSQLPESRGLEILYGIVFHPRFAENRTCYITYTLGAKDKKKPYLPTGSRISKFLVPKTEPLQVDPDSEEVVITWQGSGHNGCDLHFGPKDGMLYFSIGDARRPNPPDELNTGQDCSDLLSSILRIDVDRRDPGLAYAIPPDNPFVGTKGVRGEIWSFGYRNPYRMSFDRQTGDLWVGDVGWELWEMVLKVQKGGNYGWSIVEGRQPTKPDQPVGPTPILPPTIELPHTIAASVTGGYVYRGSKFPELLGTYVFGDWETRRIWAARFDDKGRVAAMPEIVKPNIRVSAFGEDNAGELYYVDYDTGFVHTLARNEAGAANAQFPKTLSETGIFDRQPRFEARAHSLGELALGVAEFTPAVRQWQDGAKARHLLALPGTSAVTVFDKPRKLPGQVYWHEFRTKFPVDAVLVKHLTLELADRGTRPVETQLLHFDGEDWRGYTYAWRDDASDADLAPVDGAERTFVAADAAAPGGKREITWTYHSRNQCTVCHNSWSEYALAFNLGQLNIQGEESLNPLIEFSKQGYITRVGADDKPLPPFDRESAAKERAFVGGKKPGSKAETEQLARSYLHVNCSHCHRFGGGGGQVVLEMDFDRPLNEMGLADVSPKQGSFDLPAAKLIKPGDPYSSVLYYRMAKFGRGRMPHLGSEIPDPRGLELIARWIEDLGGAEHPAFVDGPTDVAQGLASADAGLAMMRRLAMHPAGKETREKIAGAIAPLPPGPVRDLFEGYLPPDPRGRKLGSNPRPAALLALVGDAKRGEAIYFAKDMKCANCHKLGAKGMALGPDLSTIGKTRTRAELLESLLQPSLSIEPKYAQHLLQSAQGKAYTGLLVRRDDKQVVLRDAENKEIVVAVDDVELFRPSRVSMMPEGQIGGLLPQEAADLLEFLSTRK